MPAEDQPFPESTGSRNSSEGNLQVNVQQDENKRVIRLLEDFLDGDEEEQTASWRFVKRVLDEDRPEGFKLFPDAVNRS